jgi:GTP-binding protein HflX
LAQAIGLDVRFSGTVPIAHPRPATLFGSGKVEEIGAIVAAEQAAVAIVDHPLTPIQQRNLEKAWNAKVLDRTGLILEIFAERAQSKEGRLQVELARLTYQKSRLVRSWTHLERQRGGFGFLGGPGETQIEADRRAIGERIDSIKSELGVIERTRRLHRKRRKTSGQRIVALVGYTNAGKSTLFNALSGAGALAQDMLFATLDPALRRVGLPDGGAFILSDTVGFISDLPTQLVAAFRSTLEEVHEADLILHVRDISSESSEAQSSEVYKVLAEIGIDTPAGRVIEVWNKADLLSREERGRLENRAGERTPPAVLISAAAEEGLDEVVEAVQRRLQKQTCTRDVVVGHGEVRLIHWLYENTEIVSRQDFNDGNLHFHVRLPEERVRDLDRHLSRL